MSILAYLSNPLSFFVLLGVLLFAGLFAVVFSLRENKQETSKVAGLQAEVESLKKELSVKTQMYEGLKGQYEELEKDFEKATQDVVSQPAPAKVPPAQTAAKPADKPAPDRTVINLLQDLQEIQKEKATTNKNPSSP